MIRRILCYLVIGLLVMQSIVEAVDKSKFKSCDQSSFCRRCRNYQPGLNDYELLLETLEVNDTQVKLNLFSHRYQNTLYLRLISLVDSTFRLMVNEVSDIKERYVVVGALAKEPEQQNIKILSQNHFNIEIGIANGAKVQLSRKPFEIKFFYNDVLAVVANEKNLMNFEYLRKKPEAVEKVVSEDVTGDENSENKVEQPLEELGDEAGAWEESFQSFTDSKPFGPEAVALDFTFPQASNLYGIPEHADHMSLQSTVPQKNSDPYRLYNLDVFEYELQSKMAIYGAVPVIYAHGKQITAGVYWQNAAETWVDVRKKVKDSWHLKETLTNLFSSKNESKLETNVHFMSEAGIIDAFIMLGPKPKDVFKQYARLTGVAPLPPWWALGYHQCRWNYKDQNDVLTVSKTFDEFNLPLDVIWLDIEYTDDKKYFTWDTRHFPTPLKMIDELKSRDRKLVIIIDPHIKRSPGYFLHDTALQRNLYVLNENKEVYNGHCWPGDSSYLDFFKPETSEYYSSLYLFENFQTTSPEVHIWNDMNEPSVFSGPEITMPKTNLHFNGEKFFEHREVHNIYGLMQTAATFLGMLKRTNYNQRPFILTRSHFAGSQRFAAVWTGDNAAEWSHLEISLPMCLSLAMSGISFCGADVGGFFNNPDDELLVRWYQAGAWLPFFRAHAHIDTRRREPYLKPTESLNIIREALYIRYTYLPFWYLCFREHEVTGVPVILPLFAEFSDDENTFEIDDQIVIGGKIMVKPITKSQTTSTTVYFPGGPDEIWVDIYTGEIYHGTGLIQVKAPLNKIPVYQRGGTIVPKKERARRSSIRMKTDPYTLIVVISGNGTAYGNIYSDDGESYDYKNRRYLYQSYKFENNRLRSTMEHSALLFDNAEQIERIRIWNPPKSMKGAKITIESNDGGGQFETEVEYQYGDSELVIAIRNSLLKVQSNWVLDLLY